MPLANLKTSFPDEAPARSRAPAGDTGGLSTAPSPARLLQQRLELQASAAAMVPDAERWPLRRSLALIVASSIALWAAIIEAGATIVHAIA